MRFGLDARTIQDSYPGIGRYVYNLVRALAPLLEGDDTLVVLHDPSAPNTRHNLAGLRGSPQVEWTTCSVPVRSWQEQVRVPGQVRHLDLKSFHAPYYVRPYWLPCPTVVTVFDIIPHLYPAYLPSRKARLAFEVSLRLSLWTAHRVIAPSLASAVDLYQHYGVPLHRTSVIPLAAAREFCPLDGAEVQATLASLDLRRPYALYLGTNKPHKNLPRLVEAWARVMREWPEANHRPVLVIAGPEDPRYPEARERADALGLGQAVRWLGPVAEEALPALYAGADLFVFPSLYEGFGLPVLEAMACGTPVACAHTPALRELVDDNAALFDPLDVEEMAQVIGDLLRDAAARRALAERGAERATAFTWERTARATLTVYHEAAL